MTTAKNYYNNIIWAAPVYTGGGIYVAYGQMKDGTYFVGSDTMYDVRFVNANPTERNEYDEVVGDYSDWQEDHLVRDIDDEHECLEFWEGMLRWVLDRKPYKESLFCNYSEYELERDIAEIKELKREKNWR